MQEYGQSLFPLWEQPRINLEMKQERLQETLKGRAEFYSKHQRILSKGATWSDLCNYKATLTAVLDLDEKVTKMEAGMQLPPK